MSIKKSYYIAFILLVMGCSPKKCEIIKRESCDKYYQWIGMPEAKKQFLCNLSSKETVSVTIRRKTIHYRANSKSGEEKESTEVYKLKPKEEMPLLCEYYFSKDDRNNRIKYEYTIEAVF